MKALVTGGGGFLGHHLVRQLLAEGYAVRVLARGQAPSALSPDVEVARGDVRSARAVDDACRGMDVVFHLAAKAGLGVSARDYFDTNVVGTRNVVEACARCGVDKLVYTSSPSVVLSADDVRDADEDTPYTDKPLNAYQRTKAEAERIVLESHRLRRVHTTVLRPHAIWGPGDTHLLPRIVRRARQGRLRIVGSGDNLVSLTYVENAAYAHVLAARSDAVGGRAYFIAEEQPVLLWGWINQVLAGLGMRPVERRIPFAVAYALGWALEWGYARLGIANDPPMTRYLTAMMAKHHYFSTRRARDDFGFRSMVSPDEGLRKTIDFYRAHPELVAA